MNNRILNYWTFRLALAVRLGDHDDAQLQTILDEAALDDLTPEDVYLGVLDELVRVLDDTDPQWATRNIQALGRAGVAE